MKIYKLQPVPDRYAGLVLTNDGDWAWLRDKFIGATIAPWKALEVEVFSEQKNLQFSDYINLSPAIPVLSDTAVKGLIDLHDDNGQFLPLMFDSDKKLTAFNVTKMVDALDCKQSVIEFFSDGVRAKRVS